MIQPAENTVVLEEFFALRHKFKTLLAEMTEYTTANNCWNRVFEQDFTFYGAISALTHQYKTAVSDRTLQMLSAVVVITPEVVTYQEQIRKVRATVDNVFLKLAIIHRNAN